MGNKVRKLQKRREELAGLANTARENPLQPPSPQATRMRALEFTAERRLCDDELTVIAARLKPWQQKFAQLYAEGASLEDAMFGSGFVGRRPSQGAWDLMRRNEDVRRYIHLARQRAAVASTVTVAALRELLWLQVRDPGRPAAQREKAMSHLVKIMTPPPVPQTQEDEPRVGQFRGKDEAEAELDKVLGDFKARKGSP